MQLSEFIENCQTTLNNYGDLEVVFSKDDEGNDFNKVYFAPSIGHYHENDREFEQDRLPVNAVCIN